MTPMYGARVQDYNNPTGEKEKISWKIGEKSISPIFPMLCIFFLAKSVICYFLVKLLSQFLILLSNCLIYFYRDSWSNKYRNSEDSSGQHHRDPWKNNQHSRNRGDQNNSWDSKRGGGFNNKSGNNSDGRCFKCEDVGHIAKNCPTVLNNHTSSTNGQQQAASKKEEYIPPEITEDTLYEDDYMYSTGINFENYENIPCEVTGQDPPPPIETFEDINLSQLLMSNVKRAKFKNLTPVQKYAVPIILKGRDLMACAQTGDCVKEK